MANNRVDNARRRSRKNGSFMMSLLVVQRSILGATDITSHLMLSEECVRASLCRSLSLARACSISHGDQRGRR